jgi:hypothetical protein
MKTFLLSLFLLLAFIACKQDAKPVAIVTPVATAEVINSIKQDAAYNDSLLRVQHVADSVRAANIADSLEFRRITKLINGGYNGFNDRWELYQRAKKVLKND